MLWQTQDKLRCSCGNFLDESMDDSRKAAWIAEPVICWACAASERRQRKGEHPPGTKWVTRDRSVEERP